MIELALDPAARDDFDSVIAMLGELDVPAEIVRPYDVQDGVAIIPVKGVLIPCIGTLYDYGFVSGYDAIAAKFTMAQLDTEVRGIAFDINSPGGLVSGLYELTDGLYAARGNKPMLAVLTESALSAAYAIASCADGIWLPRTGNTGSIGVICSHTDYSGMLEKAGIVNSDIFFGARKADFSPFAPLSAPARDRMQVRVDTLGEFFVETVARNRNLPPSTVKGTQAAVYLGIDGVNIGLADGIASPSAAFQAFAASL
jgi:signal peptide peptidase SppA